MRVLLVGVVLLLGSLVALWQLNVLDLPFLPEPGGGPQTPSLFAALEARDLELLREGLAEGADLDVRDPAGFTPLMVAIRDGVEPVMVETLLEAGADLEARAPDGSTALHLAVQGATSAELPLLLLHAGADPTVGNNAGQNAITLAETNSTLRTSGLGRRLEEFRERAFIPGWPSGYLVPVEGATLSSRASHLPGAPRAYRNGVHEGFDFYDGTVSVPIEYGTPIRAIALGTVIRADQDYGEVTPEEYDELIRTSRQGLDTPPQVLDRLRGRQVWIRHPGGFVSRYAHLSAIPAAIVEGVTVDQGEIIGETGNSGTLEAAQGTRDDPHPHVELWRGDSYLGQGLEADAIYPIAAQVFGEDALPPYTD